jgi:UDP-glucuronate decarboxylase
MMLKFTDKIKDQIIKHDLKYVVTGCTGWLGQATIEMFEDVFGDEIKCKVIPVASTSRSYTLRSGRQIETLKYNDLLALAPLSIVVLHYAFLTRDKVNDKDISSYILGNRQITDMTCQIIRRHNTIGVFTTSSGAVYNKYGDLETDIVNNPYGRLKIEEEEKLQILAEKLNITLNICRLFNLSGPFIHKEFALNSILNGMFTNREIILRARNRVVRDFTHVEDIVSLGTSLALDSNDGKACIYDSGIGLPVEIFELARKCVNEFKMPETRIARQLTSDQDDIYIGNTKKITKLFNSHKISPKNIERQILDTGKYILSCKPTAC